MGRTQCGLLTPRQTSNVSQSTGAPSMLPAQIRRKNHRRDDGRQRHASGQPYARPRTSNSVVSSVAPTSVQPMVRRCRGLGGLVVRPRATAHTGSAA